MSQTTAAGEPTVSRCPNCGQHTLEGADIHHVTPDRVCTIGRYAVCPECHYTPHEEDSMPRTTGGQDIAPNRVLSALSAVACLSAPVLWTVWIWTGDGRFGWLSLPAIFAAVVLVVLAFAAGTSKRGQ